MKNYIRVFHSFIFIILLQNLSAQTTLLDEHSISIGDSLEQTISKFNSADYSLSCDTMESTITYRVYKIGGKQQIGSDNLASSRKCIGYLYFSDTSKRDSSQTKKLFQIGKVWSDWEHSQSLSLIESVFKIFDSEEQDNYYKDFTISKQSSSGYSTRRLTLKLKPYISLEIYIGNSNYYQVTEYITEDEHKNNNEIFLAVFDDSQHLIDTTGEILTKKFLSEKEAESGLNLWQIQYLTRGYDLPYSKVIKFWDTKIGKFKK